jgi:hypothetical protein
LGVPTIRRRVRGLSRSPLGFGVGEFRAAPTVHLTLARKLTKMIVSMHQPNYLPWIGFFSKIAHSDCYIMTDSFPYSRHSVTKRNKVRTSGGWTYLTIPVDRKFDGAKICDIRLPGDRKWCRRHWETIRQNYAKSPFFGDHADFFEELYCADFEYLWQINEQIIFYLLRCFEIRTEVVRASELRLDVGPGKTEAIIALLKSIGADTYLSGPSGRDYLDTQKFSENGLGLRFFAFQHPVYEQRFAGFEPRMSAIDLLFNVGPRSAEIIRSSGTTGEDARDSLGLDAATIEKRQATPRPTCRGLPCSLSAKELIRVSEHGLSKH